VQSVCERTFLRATFGEAHENSRAKVAKLFASSLQPPVPSNGATVDAETIRQIICFVHPKCQAFVRLVLRLTSGDSGWSPGDAVSKESLTPGRYFV
jgi:hypothetical protein